MIDAAVHLWSRDTDRYPWASDATQNPPTITGDPASLSRDLATIGATRAVVVQSSSYGDDHRYLLACLAEADGALAGVGLLRARGPEAADDAVRLIESGCSGLRIIIGGEAEWLAGPHALRVWEVAEHRSVPIGFLATPAELPAVAAVAHRQPGLTIVLDHLGLVSAATLDSARAPLTQLAGAERAFIKVSALRAVTGEQPPFATARPLLDTVRDLFGYERMIYGTDWPYAVEQDPYRATLDALDAAFEWSPDERLRVLECNARALWWPSA